ncbi:hypothetical protein ACP70R_049480 [Stipagrostis hirtigluma subsp. patula]
MFETAMRAAWGHRFYRVTQVVPNLFMAHFKEEDDLRWIWQRQPWIISKETMLVEWIDPKGVKLKVYIHYEKIAKVCSFCGRLFHNVSSCLKRQQVLWKLSPGEAAKVPEEVYGKWRVVEAEIPKEAKEASDSAAHNAYIQSFKDYFQKIVGSSCSSSADIQGKYENPGDKQLMLLPSEQQTEINAENS